MQDVILIFQLSYLGGKIVRDIRKELIDILIAEVKPALGCTEPVAVALACAKAKELLGEEIVENRIKMGCAQVFQEQKDQD